MRDYHSNFELSKNHISLCINMGVGVIGWAELIAELICDTVLNG